MTALRRQPPTPPSRASCCTTATRWAWRTLRRPPRRTRWAWTTSPSMKARTSRALPGRQALRRRPTRCASAPTRSRSWACAPRPPPCGCRAQRACRRAGRARRTSRLRHRPQVRSDREVRVVRSFKAPAKLVSGCAHQAQVSQKVDARSARLVDASLRNGCARWRRLSLALAER